MDDRSSSDRNPVSAVSSGDWPVLSLFSGAGGFDLGFLSAGFRPRLALDINPAAVTTYRKNHPNTQVIQLDLGKADPAEIENLWTGHMGRTAPFGIIGGPPCQAFSASNVHQRSNDPRRTLVHSYATIIERFASRLGLDFFVFENVPGLTSKQHHGHFNQFKHMCELAGFKIVQKVLDAGKFGVPQHRRRLIIVGLNGQRYPKIDIELPDGDRQPRPIRDVLEGLPEPVFCTRGMSRSDIPFHPNHITMVPRSPKFLNGSLKPGDCRGLSFRVLKWDSPSYTVAYGNNEVHIHPGCHRRLSVYEAMLLQGFPSWYRLEGTFSQQVHLVSDALPPPLGKSIADTIATTLGYKLAGSLVNQING